MDSVDVSKIVDRFFLTGALKAIKVISETTRQSHRPHGLTSFGMHHLPRIDLPTVAAMAMDIAVILHLAQRMSSDGGYGRSKETMQEKRMGENVITKDCRTKRDVVELMIVLRGGRKISLCLLFAEEVE